MILALQQQNGKLKLLEYKKRIFIFNYIKTLVILSIDQPNQSFSMCYSCLN